MNNSKYPTINLIGAIYLGLSIVYGLGSIITLLVVGQRLYEPIAFVSIRFAVGLFLVSLTLTSSHFYLFKNITRLRRKAWKLAVFVNFVLLIPLVKVLFSVDALQLLKIVVLAIYTLVLIELIRQRKLFDQ